MWITSRSKLLDQRGRAVEHSLHAITQVLERSLFAEELSQRTGLLQSLDARVKVVSVLALLISVSLSRSLTIIASIYALVLLLATVSAIPAAVLIRRVWLALPFFTGLIVLPALFLTPGPALVELPFGMIVTQTGATTALFLLLRVSTSVSLTLLLVLTTPWNTVLCALSVLRVPDVFILILGMTYRYVYLLLRLANDMFLSRKSRAVGRMSTAENRRILAAIGGTLLTKSLDLSGEVYLAMQSRGFRGSIVTLRPFKMQARDWVWLTALAVMVLASILLGQ
jgi:cobalt/nickel transport system permease protein